MKKNIHTLLHAAEPSTALETALNLATPFTHVIKPLNLAETTAVHETKKPRRKRLPLNAERTG